MNDQEQPQEQPTLADLLALIRELQQRVARLEQAEQRRKQGVMAHKQELRSRGSA